MTPSRQAWRRWWFRDGAPHDLAAARILFAVHGLWILLSRDLPAIAGLPGALWTGVPRSTQWRFLLFHGHPHLEAALQVATIVALVAAAVGLATRWSCLAAALLLYHLAPLETIIWHDSAMERGLEVTILALVLLAFSPCADVWSLGRRAASGIQRAGWEYHWPLAVIQLFVAQIYLFAAYAKLEHGGLAWMAPDNVRRWFLVFTQYEEIAVFTTVGRWIANQPALCAAVGTGTVLFELAFPMVLFAPRTRVILIPIAVIMHIAIYLTMNIAFLNTPQLLVFVNWAWIRDRLRRAPVAADAPAATVPAAS